MSEYPKIDGQCSVDDCESVPFRRGLCVKHYTRWRRHGDFTTVLKPGSPRSLGECSVGDCSLNAVARSLCQKHYTRWAKYGDPLITKLDRDRTTEERFWSKVDKAGPIPESRPDLGPCWVWTGALMEGYGAFWLNGTNIHAHIMSFRWAKGEIPEGWERDHLCRNRACVNPDHLEAVTHRVNVGRGNSPHGQNMRKTHCPQGHPYDDENTYHYQGERHCRECQRGHSRKWYSKE